MSLKWESLPRQSERCQGFIRRDAAAHRDPLPLEPERSHRRPGVRHTRHQGNQWQHAQYRGNHGNMFGIKVPNGDMHGIEVTMEMLSIEVTMATCSVSR